MILYEGGAGAGEVDVLENYLEGKFYAGELYMGGLHMFLDVHLDA